MIQPISPTPADPARGVAFSVIAHGLLLCGFGLALLFYDIGYNHLFLLGSSASAIILLTLVGPWRFLQTLTRQPLSVGLALLTLAGLTIQQLFFSISPETSFSGSWILAAAPLWFLVLLSLSQSVRRPRGPYLLILLVATVLMVTSALRFLLFGTRPYDPLADISGYGAFVYLALVPALHCWLCGPPLKSIRGAKRYLANGLVALLVLLAFVVLVATASRACIGLLCLAILVWLALALRKRVDLSRVLLIVGLAVGAFALGSMDSGAVKASISQELQNDSAMDQRLLLAKSSVQLMREHAPWGGGAYTFALQYPSIRSTADQTSAGRYAHNDYLQLGAEGGVLLLLPLLLLVLGVVRANLAAVLPLPGASPLPGTSQPDRHAGGWLALALVLCHALVNFVFYTLAIGMMIGIVAAWAVSGGQSAAPPSTASAGPPRRVGRALWLLAISFAWLNIGYLALDNTDLAVFSGQPGLPGVNRLRENAQQQQAYARFSRMLNSDRSLPQLALAIHGKQQLLRQARPTTDPLVAAAFEQAIAANPWNGSAYLEYAELQMQQAPSAPRGPSRRAIALLDRALQQAPADLALLRYKAHLLEQVDGPKAALDMLVTQALPWLENYWILSSQDAFALVEELGRRALALNDQVTFAQVRQARAELLALKPPHVVPPVTFMRWQQSRQAAERD